jgi:hypothetical protein
MSTSGHFSQPRDEILQILVGSQRGMRRAVPQGHHHRQVRFGIGDDQGEVLVLSVVAVEQRELLGPVRRIVEAVQVERQPSRLLSEGLDKLIDQQLPQAEERLDADGVHEPRERRLRGQLGLVVRQPITDQLKDRVVAERVVIVLVFVPGEDAIDPLPDHRQQGVRGLLPAVIERRRELPRQSDPFVKLADDQEPCIRGEPAGRVLDDDRFLTEEAKTLRPHTVYTHHQPPAASEVRLLNTLKT